MPGILDNIIDAKVERQLRERLSPAHFRVAIEEAIAFGNEKTDGTLAESAFNAFEEWARRHEADAAELLSRVSLALAIGEPQSVPALFASSSTSEPRKLSRRIVRARLVNHLRREQGISRSKAVAAVRQLTERQLDDAIGTLPVAGVGDWFRVILDYIGDHWLEILGAVLPVLLLLL